MNRRTYRTVFGATLTVNTDRTVFVIPFWSPCMQTTITRAQAATALREARQLGIMSITTELTPAGEQAVIPGCERNASPGARQLDLFG